MATKQIKVIPSQSMQFESVEEYATWLEGVSSRQTGPETGREVTSTVDDNIMAYHGEGDITVKVSIVSSVRTKLPNLATNYLSDGVPDVMEYESIVKSIETSEIYSPRIGFRYIETWDCSLEYEYEQLRKCSYPGTDLCLYSYDVHSATSFDDLSELVEEVQECCVEGVDSIVVGVWARDTTSLPRAVTKEAAEAFAREIGASAYCEVMDVQPDWPLDDSSIMEHSGVRELKHLVYHVSSHRLNGSRPKVLGEWEPFPCDRVFGSVSGYIDIERVIFAVEADIVQAFQEVTQLPDSIVWRIFSTIATSFFAPSRGDGIEVMHRIGWSRFEDGELFEETQQALKHKFPDCRCRDEDFVVWDSEGMTALEEHGDLITDHSCDPTTLLLVRGCSSGTSTEPEAQGVPQDLVDLRVYMEGELHCVQVSLAALVYPALTQALNVQSRMTVSFAGEELARDATFIDYGVSQNATLKVQIVGKPSLGKNRLYAPARYGLSAYLPLPDPVVAARPPPPPEASVRAQVKVPAEHSCIIV